VGLVRTEHGSRPCECQAGESITRHLKQAGIPNGYENASFENFQITDDNRPLFNLARRFAEDFLPGKGRRGLLMTGSVGNGKTHLAVSALRLLVSSRGARARFLDMRSLYDRLRASYDESVSETQAQILRDAVTVDLVVLDDLGAVRLTDWVAEVTELLIGELYNRSSAVIVTTNFPNRRAGEGDPFEIMKATARPQTLGDRIGARMWSRLQQMCVSIEANGQDWRTR
jgi:DNA replication protein DnaC